MEVKTCKRCNKLFQYLTGPVICNVCKQEEETIFIQVKEYIREHKGATIEEVSHETGASIALIEKFLKQGRLEVIEGSPIEITCERCGVRITTGKYCNKCRERLASALGGVTKDMRPSQEVEDNKARMRFLNSRNN